MLKFIEINNMSSKQKLVFVITALILLVVIFTILGSFNFWKKGIDYDNTNKYTFIVNSTEITDRDVYWNLNEIILKFLESYQTVEKMDTSSIEDYKYEGYSVDDYYNVLDVDYKKYLGKKNYIKVSKEFMAKFVTWNDNGFVLKKDNIIKTIYKLNNYNGYLCELNTAEGNSTASIGIILDTEKLVFNIFYIN